MVCRFVFLPLRFFEKPNRDLDSVGALPPKGTDEFLYNPDWVSRRSHLAQAILTQASFAASLARDRKGRVILAFAGAPVKSLTDFGTMTRTFWLSASQRRLFRLRRLKRRSSRQLGAAPCAKQVRVGIGSCFLRVWHHVCEAHSIVDTVFAANRGEAPLPLAGASGLKQALLRCLLQASTLTELWSPEEEMQHSEVSDDQHSEVSDTLCSTEVHSDGTVDPGGAADPATGKPYYHNAGRQSGWRCSAESDPREPPRLPGPAPHINFHEK